MNSSLNTSLSLFKSPEDGENAEKFGEDFVTKNSSTDSLKADFLKTLDWDNQSSRDLDVDCLNDTNSTQYVSERSAFLPIFGSF